MRSKFVTIILILHLCVTWIELCPLLCRCFMMTRLTLCEEKTLDKVPLGIPEYTVRLVMSGSNISSIRTHDFKELPNLRMFTITDSHLTFFDTEVLKKFKNLVSLNLKGNQLRKISKFPLHMTLKSLELHSNLLTDIDGTTFSLLRNMSILNLGNNQLSNIPFGLFTHLKNLTRLNLKNNSIRALRAGTFAGLKQLQVLDLSYNYLENLPDTIFKDNFKLDYVLLNNNNLIEIERNLFSDLYLLKVIYLSMNNLTFIHQETFTGLANLGLIYIYGNQIPCSCSFLKINSNIPEEALLIADCFLQNQSSTMISRKEKNLSLMWSNWTDGISCSKSTYLRFRLCRDCSEERHKSHCSHHIRSENSTCVMVKGRGGAYTPAFTSKHHVLFDCEVECSSTVSIITITLISVGCVVLIIVGFLCAYFLRKYRTQQYTYDTNQHGIDQTQHGDDMTQHGDDTTQHGDDMTQHGDDMTQHGDNTTQHDDDMTQHGDDTTQHGDDMTE